MSAYLMGRVFYTDLALPLKMTLLALADVADDDGSRVMLGQARIARKVGCSERTARRHLAELRKLGYLAKEGRVGPHGQDRQRIAVDVLPTHEQIALMFPRPARGDRPVNLADRPSQGQSSGQSEPLDRTPLSGDSSVTHQETHSSPTANANEDNVRQIVVSDRWPYFLEKLADQDTAWERVSIGACVRIAKATSDTDVTTALSFAAEHAPVLTGSAYGWLEATARGLMEARQSA